MINKYSFGDGRFNRNGNGWGDGYEVGDEEGSGTGRGNGYGLLNGDGNFYRCLWSFSQLESGDGFGSGRVYTHLAMNKSDCEIRAKKKQLKNELLRFFSI